MSYQYKNLPHPADIRLEVTASCKEDIFRGALEGMAHIIQPDISKRKSQKKEQIKIHSLDLNTLLVDFLNEILAKSDIYNCVFDKIKIKELTDNYFEPPFGGEKQGSPERREGGSYIEGTVEGGKVEKFSQEIKAATYHGLEIKENKRGEYEVTVLFDI